MESSGSSIQHQSHWQQKVIDEKTEKISRRRAATSLYWACWKQIIYYDFQAKSFACGALSSIKSHLLSYVDHLSGLSHWLLCSSNIIHTFFPGTYPTHLTAYLLAVEPIATSNDIALLY